MLAISQELNSKGLYLSSQKQKENLRLLVVFTSSIKPSSETQGQSVGSGEKAGRKFSSMSEGDRLSSNYFQTFKRTPAPDWVQKCSLLLCPIGEQFLLSSFREFVHDGYCLATLVLALFVHQACVCKENFYFLLS